MPCKGLPDVINGNKIFSVITCKTVFIPWKRAIVSPLLLFINTLRPETIWPPFSRRHFQMHFLEWKTWILLKISLKFVPINFEMPVSINNILALVRIMAWRRPDNKPLSEPMMVNLLTHLSVTQPQWVNSKNNLLSLWFTAVDVKDLLKFL